MLITALETLLFSKVGIDWIGIVMSGPPLVLTEVIEEEWPTLLLCASTSNMNQQDVNGNGWPGSGCYNDGYLFSVLFLDVFSLILVSGKGIS